MNFVQRVIDVTFTLGQGQFVGSPGNNITLTGIDSIKPGPRVSCQISGAGGAVMSNLELQIFGMTLDQMNQLSTLGISPSVWRRNSIVVFAGDANTKPTVVFGGTILEAWVDGQSAPDVCFRVTAQAGYINALKPAPAISFNGSVDIATALNTIAQNMDSENGKAVTVQNPQGVSVQLSNPYFAGSARGQAAQAIQQAGLEWNGMDDGTITFWKPGQTRGDTAIEIGPDTGLVGYPSCTSNGIMFTHLFDPRLRFGTNIKVTSALFEGPGFQANSNRSTFSPRGWTVNGISHDIAANMPGGKWFSTVSAVPFGYGPAVPSSTGAF